MRVLLVLLMFLNFESNCFSKNELSITETINSRETKDSIIQKKRNFGFSVQYRHSIYNIPGFFFDYRKGFPNGSFVFNNIEFGLGISTWGLGSWSTLSAQFEPQEEWISKARLKLIYLDFPISYNLIKFLKIKKSKLLFGVTPQVLIAGKSQFVSQLENPTVVHVYDRFRDADYYAFETKFNMRFMVEYRYSLIKHFEIGVNYWCNLRPVAPTYYSIDHSVFNLEEPRKVGRIGGITLVLAYTF